MSVIQLRSAPGAGRGPRARRTAAATAGAIGLAAMLAAPFAAPDAQAQSQPYSLPDLVESVSPAVVTILATQAPPERGYGRSPFGRGSPFEGTPFEEFFERFGDPRRGPMQPDGRRAVGLGSGFVLESDGYVVTNNHVIDRAEDVTVRMADDREFKAEIIGVDAQSDLALLKIDAADLPHLTLGDSEALRVGEDVIAVGNPFGLGGTVTRGIVSALARDINAGPYVDYIQTDAAINRGNSGGPLLNVEGEVVGVNTAIFSPSGGSVGVGFAVPSNTVKTVVAQLKNGGVVERGWLGVSIQRVTPDIADAIGLGEARGALVADVVSGGPSDDVLRSGDVILSFAGEPVAESRDLPKLVGAARPGQDVDVTVLRDGEEVDLTVNLGRFEDASAASTNGGRWGGGSEEASERLGATVAAATPRLKDRFGLPERVSGLVVVELDPSGRAAEAGLRVGDVILSVGSRSMETPRDLDAAIGEARSGAVLMQIARGDGRLFIGVPIG